MLAVQVICSLLLLAPALAGPMPELLSHVTQYLESEGVVDFYVDFATLLGQQRGGKFLEGEKDIDITVAKESVHFLRTSRFNTSLAKVGYQISNLERWPFLRLLPLGATDDDQLAIEYGKGHPSGLPYLDVYELTCSAALCQTQTNTFMQPSSMLLPSRYCTVSGARTRCPANPIKVYI